MNPMANRSSSASPLLRLPSSVRQRIYIYLLAPHAKETVTTINYSLRWPWFENPSNTTFNGAVQIDLCRCPQNSQKPRSRNSKTEDHIYSRSRCYGPNVRFNRESKDLWVCGDSYADSGQINFLKPGIKYEQGYEPHPEILATCQLVYQEAVSVLYRNRNFMFLTGPCPRGRYQAYATRVFLSRLSPLARANVTSLSITAVPYEEDANVHDAGEAYRTLAVYIQLCLPSFKTLHLSLWNERIREAVASFERVFENNGVEVSVGLRYRPMSVLCKDASSFRSAIHSTIQAQPIAPQREPDPALHKRSSGRLKRKQKQAALPKVLPRWEEVGDETTVDNVAATRDEVLRRLDSISFHTGIQKELLLQGLLSTNREEKEKNSRRGSRSEDGTSDEEWFDASARLSVDEWEIVPRATEEEPL